MNDTYFFFEQCLSCKGQQINLEYLNTRCSLGGIQCSFQNSQHENSRIQFYWHQFPFQSYLPSNEHMNRISSSVMKPFICKRYEKSGGFITLLFCIVLSCRTPYRDRSWYELPFECLQFISQPVIWLTDLLLYSYLYHWIWKWEAETERSFQIYK